MRYQHTQRGLLWLPVLAGGLIFLGIMFVLDDNAAVWVWSVCLVVCVMLLVLHFSRLTVTVDASSVTAGFGFINRPHRRIELDEIVSAEVVRNSWWYGYGARWFPGGTIYNVQGNDAVELVHTSGKKFRIGTDDVENLHGALDEALNP